MDRNLTTRERAEARGLRSFIDLIINQIQKDLALTVLIEESLFR